MSGLDDEDRRARVRVALLAVAVATVAHAPAIAGMARTWQVPGNYYEHGPLVPLAAAWLAWRARDAIRAARPTSSARGLVVLGASAWLLAVGVAEASGVLASLSSVLAIAGIVLALLGPHVARAAWASLAVLAFAVPVPNLVADELTFRGKLLATKLAVAGLGLAGIPAVRAGSAIHLVQGQVDVSDSCAGLRSAISLGALAFVFAADERVRWKRAAHLIVAPPVAVAANAARVVLLCALESTGHPAREGLAHELVGISVYVLALVAFLAVRALPAARVEEPAPAERPAPRPLARGTVAVTFAILLASAVVAHRPRGAPALPGTRVTRDLPAHVGSWTGVTVSLPRDLDETDAALVRYSSPAEEAPVEVYVVHAERRTHRVLHAPENCYAAMGYVPELAETIALRTATRRFEATRAGFEHGEARFLVVSWFRLGDRTVGTPLELRLRSLAFRLVGSSAGPATHVRLATPVTASGSRAAEERLERFALGPLDSLLGRLP